MSKVNISWNVFTSGQIVSYFLMKPNCFIFLLLPGKMGKILATLEQHKGGGWIERDESMDPIRLLLYSCPASREIFNGMLLRINSHQLLAWCWCRQKRQKWEMPWYPSDWLTDWLVWQNFWKDLAKHILPIVFSKFFLRNFLCSSFFVQIVSLVSQGI